MILSLRFKRIIRTSGIVFISGFIYYFSTQIGRDDLIYPGYTSPIWLASGVALGLTLLLGNCAIFGIFLASFLSSSGMDLSSGVWIDIGKNLYLSFLIGLFSALQSYIGKVVLSGRIPKYRISDRTQFVFLLFFSKRLYVSSAQWVLWLRCIF